MEKKRTEKAAAAPPTGVVPQTLAPVAVDPPPVPPASEMVTMHPPAGATYEVKAVSKPSGINTVKAVTVGAADADGDKSTLLLGIADADGEAPGVSDATTRVVTVPETPIVLVAPAFK